VGHGYGPAGPAAVAMIAAFTDGGSEALDAAAGLVSDEQVILEDLADALAYLASEAVGYCAAETDTPATEILAALAECITEMGHEP
jgi:L-asparagine transporter-like permease